MAIEPTNGKEAQQTMPLDVRARIYPVSPEYSQWEVKIHVETDLGMGKEIIGEMTLRSFNGGVAPLDAMLRDVFKAAKTCIDQASAMLRQMQKQQREAQSQIVTATRMPSEKGS